MAILAAFAESGSVTLIFKIEVSVTEPTFTLLASSEYSKSNAKLFITVLNTLLLLIISP